MAPHHPPKLKKQNKTKQKHETSPLEQGEVSPLYSQIKLKNLTRLRRLSLITPYKSTRDPRWTGAGYRSTPRDGQHILQVLWARIEPPLTPKWSFPFLTRASGCPSKNCCVLTNPHRPLQLSSCYCWKCAIIRSSEAETRANMPWYGAYPA